MKRKCLLGVVLMLYMLFFISDQSPGQQYSPQFQSFLNQVQQTYLASKRNNLASLRDQYPSILAILIGHALKEQMIHVHQNPSLTKQYVDLQREAQAYITEVAEKTPARFENGTRYKPWHLLYVMNNAFEGTEDNYILETCGVRTGTMPSVFGVSQRPQPPSQSVGPPVRYAPTVKEEERKEKKGPDPLDREAPPAKVKESEIWEPPPAAVAPSK